MNEAVAYIHSKPRSEWDDYDHLIDDTEVSGRPAETGTGWWEESSPKA